jgi:hypothetical protein
MSRPRPAEQEDLGALLDEVRRFVERFVRLEECEAVAVSLWVAHTHALAAADVTPYLSITSPEKGSGKTRLLEVLQLIVAKPWFTGRVTPAVLVRKVADQQPTLLLDEVDAAFAGDPTYSEHLRGVLNTGFKRGGCASVCVGPPSNLRFQDLATFCPKAIAGIGRLPDTVADRSIPVRLRRRAKHEPIDRFRERTAKQDSLPLRKRLERWASSSAPRTLSGVEPALPEGISDRQEDVWEPLLAIAESAGPPWQAAGMEACRLLCATVRELEPSPTIQLLEDIRRVFRATDCDRVKSAQLARALSCLEESSWGDLAEEGGPRLLAKRLRAFAITPIAIRFADGVHKGYYRRDFIDVWNRYLAAEESTRTVPDVTAVPDPGTPGTRGRQAGDAGIQLPLIDGDEDVVD